MLARRSMSTVVGPSSTATVPVNGSWSTMTLPSPGGFFKVVYGNGIFVATNGGLAYSTDGINWSSSTTPSFSGGLNGITFGGGKFVTVPGNRTAYLYSTDGTSWTVSNMPVDYVAWAGPVYGNSKFVAVSYSMYNNTVSSAAYSSDGINWTKTTMPSFADWNSLAFGNGRFVAFSDSTSAAYSTDGINWTAIPTPRPSYKWRISFANGLFFGVSNGDLAASSSDGINWTFFSLPGIYNWTEITYGNGLFVSIAGGTPIAAYSIDGTHWDARPAPLPLSQWWTSVDYVGGMFIALDNLNVTTGAYTSIAKPSPIIEGFETTPLNSSLNFTGNWKRTTTVTSLNSNSTTINPHSGSYYYASNNQSTNSSTSSGQFTIPFSGTLEFWYAVSSEDRFDYLHLTVAGTNITPSSATSGTNSGSVPWTKVTQSVVQGDVVAFHYIKDGSGSYGQDSAFIDDIKLS